MIIPLIHGYGMPPLIPDSHLKVKGKNLVMKKIRLKIPC